MGPREATEIPDTKTSSQAPLKWFSQLAAAGVVAIAWSGLVSEATAAGIVCAVTPTVVRNGDLAVVTAWLGAPSRGGQADFTTNDGTVRQTSPTTADWMPPKSRGTYVVDITATYVDGSRERCSARVVVTGSDLGPGPESARTALLPASREERAYRSYTYFLLPSRQSDRAERNLIALEAFLAGVFELEKVARHYHEKSEINLWYVPLEKAFAMGATPKDVLALFDYVRARRMLGGINASLLQREGPLVISGAEPLWASSKNVAVLDLSGVPTSMIAPWLSAYTTYLQQGTLAGESFQAPLVLRMATVLEVLGAVVPNVAASVGQWVKVF